MEKIQVILVKGKETKGTYVYEGVLSAGLKNLENRPVGGAGGTVVRAWRKQWRAWRSVEGDPVRRQFGGDAVRCSSRRAVRGGGRVSAGQSGLVVPRHKLGCIHDNVCV